MTQNPREHGLPASHCLHFVDLTKRWGVSERELFSGTGLRREDLVDPHFSLPVPLAVAMIERARALTREPGLGLYLGLQMSVRSTNWRPRFTCPRGRSGAGSPTRG